MMVPRRTIAGFLILPMRAPRRRRLIQLYVGLVLFGVGNAIGLEAALGVSPWTVFHEGAADRLGISIGTMVQLSGLIVVLSLRPLKEPIGFGTIMIVIVIGFAVDATLWLVPPLGLPMRITMLVAAPILIGLSSGLYIGAGLGPGPRDGVMTALERRGVHIGVARLAIELTVLFVGWLLGGTVGIGTIWIALSTGWFIALFLPRLRIDANPWRERHHPQLYDQTMPRLEML
jgi:uncharacterized membrane protein YczE